MFDSILGKHLDDVLFVIRQLWMPQMVTPPSGALLIGAIRKIKFDTYNSGAMWLTGTIV